MAHLITGYAGYEHIQSADQGSFNAAFFGGGQYVMEFGNQFEASIIDNNTVRVLDGDLLMYGRHVRIASDTYEDVAIDTGTAGVNRIDLICMTYEKNATDGTEKAFLEVIKGIATEGTAQIPSYTDGNILEGASTNQMPLYQVKIEGVVLSEVTALFTTIPTYKTLAEKYAAQFEATIKALKAADILDSMEEIEANTQENMFAGALAVKEGFVQVNEEMGDIKTALEETNSDLVNHTHNYAGSSSAGGAATTALECTGNAATATKLATKRTIQIKLSSADAASFDGSANVTPGVTGTLPVGNGGTGVTTLPNLRKELIVTETTEVTAELAAGAQTNIELTAPVLEGYTFYAIGFYMNSTANIVVQSLSTTNMRVWNNATSAKSPKYTIRWIGIRTAS